MKPEDIQDRDFMVGLRGYDKDEVRSFLAEIAANHAQVLAELDESRTLGAVEAPGAAAAPARDDFENLGASVAAILRAAKDSAGEISSEADLRATEVREDADRYAANLREQADAIRSNAAQGADSVRVAAAAQAQQQREAAQASLDEAHDQAERILKNASDRANALEIETEARLRNRVDAMVAEADRRIADAQEKEDSLRSRLLDTNDELQLALMALGESAVAVVDAVVSDLRHTAQSELEAEVDADADVMSEVEVEADPVVGNIPAWS